MSITTRGLLKGATVLVAALAWNEAAKSAVDYIVPLDRDHQDKSKRMIANIVYAAIVTVLIIIIIFVFNAANSVNYSNSILGAEIRFEEPIVNKPLITHHARNTFAQ